MFTENQRRSHERTVRHHEIAVGALTAERRRYERATGQDGSLTVVDLTTHAGRRLQRAMRREQKALDAVHASSRITAS